MEASYSWGTSACILAVTFAWKMLNWLWLRPKRLERLLRAQGLQGNPYRLLVGDLKEILKTQKEVTSKPMNLSHDIVPRVLSYDHHSVNKHGKNSFIWFGPKPRVILTDPELIKDVLNKIYDFPKPETNVLAKLLVSGLADYVGEKWNMWGDDAKEFKPERFSEGVSKATNGRVSFLPFGWGPRICLGQNFSLLEAKIALSMILQHFSFELSPTYAHAPVTVVSHSSAPIRCSCYFTKSLNVKNNKPCYCLFWTCNCKVYYAIIVEDCYYS